MSLTIHHLQVGQSERILWLAEELSIPYTLHLHQRDPIFSPPSIKSLHALGQAPIIQDGTLTLAESGACADYILAKYGHGKLVLAPSHPDFAHYLYWFHFANGNLQPTLFRLMTLKSTGADENGVLMQRMMEQIDKVLTFMDQRLAETGAWLAGAEFTAADCMNVFTLTTMRTFVPVDLSRYANILAYLRRVVERDGYRRARAKGDPELPLMVDGPPPVSFVERLKAEGKL